MEREDILKVLPHRYPFLMVDKILDIQFQKSVVGVKNISQNEPWVPGHFPGAPIFPGVLIIETMAQISAFMFYDEASNEKAVCGYLCGVNKMKFVKKVYPGDALMVKAEFRESIANLVQVECTALVDGEIVASGVLSYALEK